VKMKTIFRYQTKIKNNELGKTKIINQKNHSSVMTYAMRKKVLSCK